MADIAAERMTAASGSAASSRRYVPAGTGSSAEATCQGVSLSRHPTPEDPPGCRRSAIRIQAVITAYDAGLGQNKPGLYADAGAPHLWRIEGESGLPVVHTYELDDAIGCTCPPAFTATGCAPLSGSRWGLGFESRRRLTQGPGQIAADLGLLPFPGLAWRTP